MELEFPFKFDALALQIKSEILQNWFNLVFPEKKQVYSTKLSSKTESTCLHMYNGDEFGRVYNLRKKCYTEL